MMNKTSFPLDKIKDKNVAVIGIGGVGGAALIALARLGIKNLIVMDGDVVEDVNISRQLLADYATCGMLKVDAAEVCLEKINPEINLTKIPEMFDRNTKDLLFKHKIDFLIDAVDDLKNKKLLLRECCTMSIPFISSMGAAYKKDVTLVNVTTLKKTKGDPVARILRRDLKDFDFPVVASCEEPNIEMAYMPVVTTFGLLLSDFCVKYLMKAEEDK